MPINLPPPPSNQPIDSWQWRDWFYRLVQAVLGAVGSGAAGDVPVSTGPSTPPVWTPLPYVVEQPFTSQTSVLVNHNLGRRPLVQVRDTASAMMIPKNVIHSSANSFVVLFSIPTTGTIMYLV